MSKQMRVSDNTYSYIKVRAEHDGRTLTRQLDIMIADYEIENLTGQTSKPTPSEALTSPAEVGSPSDWALYNQGQPLDSMPFGYRPDIPPIKRQATFKTGKPIPKGKK
jgi:hypothetical protein